MLSYWPALQFFLHPHNNRMYRDILNCKIQHKNAPEDGLLKSETCTEWAKPARRFRTINFQIYVYVYILYKTDRSEWRVSVCPRRVSVYRFSPAWQVRRSWWTDCRMFGSLYIRYHRHLMRIRQNTALWRSVTTFSNWSSTIFNLKPFSQGFTNPKRQVVVTIDFFFK